MGPGLLSSYALEQPTLISLLALRTRGIRLWLAAIGLAAFGAGYFGPIALAMTTPGVSRSVQLPTLTLPAIGFPTLTVPKLHAAPTTPPVVSCTTGPFANGSFGGFCVAFAAAGGRTE